MGELCKVHGRVMQLSAWESYAKKRLYSHHYNIMILLCKIM